MDMNADGKADLVATTTRGLAVYLSTGNSFASAALLPASDVRAVAAGDLRGDHMLGLEWAGHRVARRLSVGRANHHADWPVGSNARSIEACSFAMNTFALGSS
jgi:hypothetical protein